MKKTLYALFLGISSLYYSQAYTTGTVTLGSTGMSVKIDTNPNTVTLTLSGSSTAYLAIGFNASNMGGSCDGFIYNSTAKTDYKIGSYSTPSADATQNWTVSSNTVSGTTRTIVATRPLSDGDSADYTFTNNGTSLNIIYAKGGSTTLSQHGGSASSRGAKALTFSAALGVDDTNFTKNKILVYPNPAKDYFSIQNKENISSINVFNTVGEKVKSFNPVEDRYPTNDMKKGVYFIEITTKDNQKSYEKIIIE